MTAAPPVSPPPAMPAGTYPNLNGNWQIQTSAAPMTPGLPTSGLLMLGALSNSDATVTGTFRVFNLGLTYPTLCGLSFPTTEAFTGTVDTTGKL